MKRGIIALFLLVSLISFSSADIIFTQPINAAYNLGDSIFVPVTIKTLNDVTGVFQMDLVCNGTEINFYKNGIKLISGDEKSLDSSLILIRNIIGGSSGMCRIKAILGAEYALSNEFKISDSLSISGSLGKIELNPGGIIEISGKITRENGENANGFIDAEVITNDINQEIKQSGTITNGLFSINISIPSNLKAGDYKMNIKAYEKDSDGLVTNNGNKEYEVYIKQMPTNLELKLENKEIEPGTSLKIRTILHDQTGESINSTVFITIKDTTDKIIEQKEINTNEFLEYAIKSNEPPAEWKIFAVSNQLTAEDTFSIKEKEDINIQIINKTISITNTGNVPYNKTILIKIGDESKNLLVVLKVGESKRYLLKAPDGDYNVKISDGSDEEVTGTMSLTGKAIDIREASEMSITAVIWVLVILILLVIVYIYFRKIYKKPFFGRRIHKKEKNSNEKMFSLKPKKDYKILNQTGNKAELSLSIKGEQQDASVACIKIKNLRELRTGRGSASEAIRKIIDASEEKKGTVYENQDYLFLIFAPTNTKTFKNERTALDIAEKAKEILLENNRMFNQKVEFGISLNYGTIVAKVENGVFKFMSMGSFMTISKKIASLAKDEVLVSDKINDLLRLQQVRTEKEMRDGTAIFIVKGIKKEDEQAKKFIERFMNRQDKDNY